MGKIVSRHRNTSMLGHLSSLTVLLTLVNSTPRLNLNSYNGVTKTPTSTIAEFVVASPKLSTLLAAVQAAGLVDTLAGEGPFTVFAPTNLAFSKIPPDTLNSLLEDKEALTEVLLRHVVPGAALMRKDVPNGSTQVQTAGGEEVQVNGIQWYNTKYVTIESSAGEATVTKFDIIATNEVVHIVDSVF